MSRERYSYEEQDKGQGVDKVKAIEDNKIYGQVGSERRELKGLEKRKETEKDMEIGRQIDQ